MKLVHHLVIRSLGLAVGLTVLVVGAVFAAGTAAAAPSGPAPRSVLIILVTWPGGGGTPAAGPDGVTPASAAGQIGAVDTQWYQSVSHGQFAGWTAAAIGPYSIATPGLDSDGSCGNPFRAGIQGQGNQAAMAAGANPGDYDVVMYYFSWMPCGWSGWTIGNAVWINGSMTTAVTAHELGHTLGLGHGDGQLCRDSAGQPTALSGSCQTIPYGDVYNAMGCCGPGSFSVIQQADLGWLVGRQVDVPASGGTFTVQPLETNSTGLQALRIVDGAETLWVEYRQPLGVDSWLSAASTNGVLVHRQLPDSGSAPAALGSYLLDMTPGSAGGFSDAALRPGTSWSNPLGNLTIAVTSANATGAQLTITSTLRPVPDVVGEDAADATTLLKGAGFAVKRQSVVDATCNHIGEVISQTPAAGTLAGPGSVVTIRVGVRPGKPCP